MLIYICERSNINADLENCIFHLVRLLTQHIQGFHNIHLFVNRKTFRT